MTAQTPESHLSHPLLEEALRHFQHGEWENGLEKLDELKEKYPLEDDLRHLVQEMNIRAKIDSYEEDEKNQETRRTITTWATRIGVVILVIGLIVYSVRTYASWAQEQVAMAQQRVEQEAQNFELRVKFQNAQNLLLANRHQEAQFLLNEIAEIQPDYPDLEKYMDRAERQASLESTYNDAVQRLEAGDREAALGLFQEIQAINSLYKDVPLQIESINRTISLETTFEEANEAFEAGQFEDAVEGYEALRTLEPSFQPDDVENRLMLSYINAAEAALSDPSQTLEGLEVAEGYFRKALALRPQNDTVLEKWEEARDTIEERLVNSYVEAALASLTEEEDSLTALNTAETYFQKALELRPESEEITRQFELVKRYLGALDDYRRDDWNSAINKLELVYQEDPSYAGGTARQTLYETYIARGDAGLASGEYESALVDYQRAAIIAQQAPDSTLRLYEAQIKLAYIQGLLFDYERAVLLYQSAVQLLELEEKPELAQRLDEAETLAEGENYRLAYVNYRDALATEEQLYTNVLVHEVQPDEYLTMIARRYNSTVQAIADLNDILNPNRIVAGQELLVPYFPEAGN